MSRRTGSYRDPTSRRAAAEFALGQLASVLTTVRDRERAIILMRFGLLDYEPKTLDEIGQRYGVTRERVRQIEARVMSKLRHPSRATVLRDYLDDEGIAGLPDHVRARILGEPVTPGAMKRCDRHGWYRARPESSDRPVCGSCPCTLLWSWTGRPKRYCSSECRQAAYRRRQQTKNNSSRREASRVTPTGRTTGKGEGSAAVR